MKTAKKDNSSSTATEHGVGSSLPEHGETKKLHAAATTSGPAAKKSKPEVLVSGLAAPATRESDLEGLRQEACANTSPLQRSLSQHLNTLGHYPKRHKVPKDKTEIASNSLAKKLANRKSGLPPAAQWYLGALQAASTATEHAADAERLTQQVNTLGHYPKRHMVPKDKAEIASNSRAIKLAKHKSALPPAAQRYLGALQAASTATEQTVDAERLMQQVRKLGHLPRESASKPDERALARDLREATSNSLLDACEEKLQDLATKDAEAAAASTATMHAADAERLTQQVRELGHQPRESASKLDEGALARDLREAKSKSLLDAVEEELQDLATKDAEAAAGSTATERAQYAERLTQQVRKLGRLPRESASKLDERALARDLREAKSKSLLDPFEEELRGIAAADAKAISRRLATEQAQAVTTLRQKIYAATALGEDIRYPRAAARPVRKMAADKRVLQSPLTQALAEEMRWMLARQSERRRAEQKAARTKNKRQRLLARRRERLSGVMRTLQQLRRSSLRCNCHDFACWVHIWRLDPEIATTLRQTGHHLPTCALHSDYADCGGDVICPHSLYDFADWPSDASDESDVSEESDEGSTECDLSEPAAKRTQLDRGTSTATEHATTTAAGSMTRSQHKAYNTLGTATEHPSSSDALQRCVANPVRPRFLGTKPRCRRCASMIHCGLLHGGQCDGRKHLGKFVRQEIGFYHDSDTCEPGATFHGCISRHWLLCFGQPICRQPGSDVGVTESAYRDLLENTGATADYELGHYRFSLAGRLLRSKVPVPSARRCADSMDSKGNFYAVTPSVRPRQRLLRLELDFQLNDGDVSARRLHLPLAAVDAIDPTILHKLADATVNTLGRWPHAHEWHVYQRQRTETRLARLLSTWARRPRQEVGNFFAKAQGMARLAQLRTQSPNDRPSDASDESDVSEESDKGFLGAATCAAAHLQHILGAATEQAAAAWARDVEAELTRLGLGVAAVEARQVFHHTLQGWPHPRKRPSAQKQQEWLAKAGLPCESQAAAEDFQVCNEKTFFAVTCSGTQNSRCTTKKPCDLKIRTDSNGAPQRDYSITPLMSPRKTGFGLSWKKESKS
jgi:hypothetical protein